MTTTANAAVAGDVKVPRGTALHVEVLSATELLVDVEMKALAAVYQLTPTVTERPVVAARSAAVTVYVAEGSTAYAPLAALMVAAVEAVIRSELAPSRNFVPDWASAQFVPVY